MLLEYDKIAQVKDIARQIAKEELEAMDTLKAEIEDVAAKIINLEIELKDLKAEINRAKEVEDQSVSETSKPHKKGVFK